MFLQQASYTPSFGGLGLMRKRRVDGDVDFLREALRVLVEEIMEADVSSRTGAGYGERNPERVTQRNGYRSRAWDTRVGTMESAHTRSSEKGATSRACRSHGVAASELCWR